MQPRFGWQGAASVAAIALFGLVLLAGSCRRGGQPVQSTAAERLQPSAALPAQAQAGGTIYVPVYSSLYLGVPNRANTVDLGATVSVRNVSPVQPITLDWVRYYDSAGKPVREYLETASTLAPMGSVEFHVQRSDAAGGPGANFLVRWHAAVAVDEPLVEAIMLGQSGNAGISFSSRGRTLTPPAER